FEYWPTSPSPAAGAVCPKCKTFIPERDEPAVPATPSSAAPQAPPTAASDASAVVTTACPNCATTFAAATGRISECPKCGTFFRPKPVAPPTPAAAAPAVSPEPISPSIARGARPCLRHPERMASETCSRCGDFICALCARAFNRRLLCPDCLAKEAGAT